MRSVPEWRFVGIRARWFERAWFARVGVRWGAVLWLRFGWDCLGVVAWAALWGWCLRIGFGRRLFLLNRGVLVGTWLGLVV
jgi:hypothetical protein